MRASAIGGIAMAESCHLTVRGSLSVVQRTKESAGQSIVRSALTVLSQTEHSAGKGCQSTRTCCQEFAVLRGSRGPAPVNRHAFAAVAERPQSRAGARDPRTAHPGAAAAAAVHAWKVLKPSNWLFALPIPSLVPRTDLPKFKPGRSLVPW